MPTNKPKLEPCPNHRPRCLVDIGKANYGQGYVVEGAVMNNQFTRAQLTRFANYPKRCCKSMHECAVCEMSIALDTLYYDGGYGRRAHIKCVTEKLEQPITKDDFYKDHVNGFHDKVPVFGCDLCIRKARLIKTKERLSIVKLRKTIDELQNKWDIISGEIGLMSPTKRVQNLYDHCEDLDKILEDLNLQLEENGE